MASEREVVRSLCGGCGTSFVCGAEAGLKNCWCMEKPVGLLAPEADGRCYCPACLDQRISAVGRPEDAQQPTE